MSFEAIWHETLGLEGRVLVSDPLDSGGATKYGVTERVAREAGYTGDMRDLTEPQARAIARARYWDLISLDRVESIAGGELAAEMFDSGYLCGQGTVVIWLQRSLNGLNRQERDYLDIGVDGLIGPQTLHALRRFMEVRQTPVVLIRLLDCLQGEYHLSTVERRPKDERFLNGWISKRVGGFHGK